MISDQFADVCECHGDREVCPGCGGETLLRGKCVLPWCPSWDAE